MKFLSSLRLTVICLTFLMALVFFTTLAQVNVGVLEAKRQYFSGVFVWKSVFGVTIPVFPSGIVIGWVLFVNLIAAHFTRFKWGVDKVGIWLIHSGLIVLLIGSACTYYLADETQMVLPEGQSATYSESQQRLEVALIKEVGDTHQVISIPYELLKLNKPLSVPQAGIVVIPRVMYANSQLLTLPPDGTIAGLMGIARQLQVREIDVFKKDNFRNISSVYLEVLDDHRPKGVYLLSNGIEVSQALALESGNWWISLRAFRDYNPYVMSLKDFRHDVYPGTQIPKNFSSQVVVTDSKTGQSFESIIYMNHPLRHQGKTYYQASFSDNSTTSILQVVHNPSWIFPYLASVLMGVGLIVQFGLHIVKARRKKS